MASLSVIQNNISHSISPTKTCCVCHKKLPASPEYFYRDKGRRDGLMSRCKLCDNQRHTMYKKTDRGREANRRAQKKFRKKNRNKDYILRSRKRQERRYKEVLLTLKEPGCSLCGYNECAEALDFHHINPSNKEKCVNRFSTLTKLRNEASKCAIVCANCHREIHAGVSWAYAIIELERKAHVLPEAWLQLPPDNIGTHRGHRHVVK
jgi:superfamily II DNA helicase RecQ